MMQSGTRRAEPLPFPVDARGAARVLADSGEPWFWLDGAAAPAGEARVSLLGIGAELRHAHAGGERAFLEALRGEAPIAEEALRGEALVAGRTPAASAGTPELSGGATSRAAGASLGTPEARGFASGWILALGYEFGLGLLGVEPPGDGPPDLGMAGARPADRDPATHGEPPVASALRADVVLAVDHDSGLAELRGEPAAVRLWSERFAERLRVAGRAIPPRAAPAAPPPSADPAADAGRPRWRRSDSRYRADIDACRAAIREGEAYVLCLTDTAELRGRFDPLESYLRIRGAGGAIRGGVIALGDRALVSASPERFLGVRAGTVETHPIKGTRPRGTTAERDAALAEELAADPKERAENLMIVDLMRNDLSRVCAPGSVRVDGFLRVEHHTHVHQLVSTVIGALAPGNDALDAIAACFPGGSMTGAPKRRAVEILREREGAPRGLYSGCFGWLDDAGDAELAMTIRGIEIRDPGSADGRALVGAGGGITIDSDPVEETAEKHLKAAPLLAALRLVATGIRDQSIAPG
ncbi:anthranilate synthase component I family protein [Leucobacter allii]|uniref:anthranilate synthase component I family protein n=1 Tax=Leucobacter allii TaxID=2932247 RepID=UPI001FD2111B|nr:anthranilate synthase component I family protein [Leucobacter allii]UOR03254.1 anthranilate synthase component I family protein [Leucobacter allii]